MAERIVERLIRERDTRYGDGIYTTTQSSSHGIPIIWKVPTLTAKQTAQAICHRYLYHGWAAEQVNS